MLDWQIESHELIARNHQVGFMHVIALNSEHLVAGFVHLALSYGARERPVCLWSYRSLVAGRQSDLDLF